MHLRRWSDFVFEVAFCVDPIAGVVPISQIYVSDLDGTLLRSDATLSDYSKRHLIELLDNGLMFTVASARSVVAMQNILQGVPLRLPVIEFNGAFLSDLATGKHEVIHEIDRRIVPEILHLVRQHRCLPFVSTFNGKEDCLYYESIANEGMRWYFDDRTKAKDKRLRHAANLSDTFRDHVICFTVIDRKEALSGLAAELEQRYSESIEIHFFENEYSSGWYWLTAHDRRATKDQAIRILLDRLGLSANELTVFGDNANDIKMFKLAARAVAVSNATDELKRYATQIIGTNDEDSVVRYIMADYSF
jgi:hypothetical protein